MEKMMNPVLQVQNIRTVMRYITSIVESGEGAKFYSLCELPFLPFVPHGTGLAVEYFSQWSPVLCDNKNSVVNKKASHLNARL